MFNLANIELTEGLTLEEYKLKYINCDRSMGHILETMYLLNESIEGIIFLGGQTVREETMGHRKMRKASEDIDILVKNQNQLDELEEFSKGRGGLYRVSDFSGILGEIRGNPISIQLGNVYGLKERVIKFKGLNLVSPESLSALKMKRPKTRPKDIIDISSLLLASMEGKIGFDLSENRKIANEYNSKSVLDMSDFLVKLDCLKKEERKKIEYFLQKKN